MTRPKRIDLPFCMYHVICRTNSGDNAFKDARDRNKFFHYLAKYADLFEYRIHAFCLMGNHFHLLLESTERPAISEMMRRLLTAYTIYYNRRHNRRGHLFQGRFKSLIVDKADYLLAVSRYIHLNPADMQKPRNPWKFPGSSLRYYINGGEPEFLHTGETLSWFSGDRNKYRRFIEEGLEQDIRLQIHQQRYIGGENFIRRTNKRLKMASKNGSQSSAARKIFEKRIEDRDRREAGKLLEKVAEYFEIDPETIRLARHAHGKIGRARLILIGLLRENIPWTSRRIGEFVGINKPIYGYMKKIKTDKELTKIFNKLKDDKKSRQGRV